MTQEKPTSLPRYARVLSIAGSDSGGGAGIQADLKTFSALGCYGMTAITAITAQNTQGVRGIHGIPPDMLRAQIDAVVEDIGVDAVKIGMLASPEVVQVVADAIRRHQLPHVVLDPVMVANALSNAFLDGQALNAYRHVPNAGTRKGWAGPDASARGLALALMAVRGEMGYPRPLSAPEWGFEAVHLQGRPLRLEAAPGNGVMDQLIFKLYPAQRNATTAVECALRLHAWLAGRVAQVRQVRVFTQDEAMRRIDKTGPLPNRAARDHSMQYIVASVLLRGRLQAEDYADEAAADPCLEALRARVVVREDAGYTRDHHDPRVLSCANAIEIELDDGTCSPRVEVLYPPGDVQRRAEALPALEKKFDALTQRLDPAYRDRLLALFSDTGALLAMPVTGFMALLSRNPA